MDVSGDSSNGRHTLTMPQFQPNRHAARRTPCAGENELMFRITKKVQLADKIKEFEVEAPFIARKAKQIGRAHV